MMIKKAIYSSAVCAGLIFTSFAAQAANVLITEAPTSIRFEQYTGAGATMAFWRLPTPGTSTFPSGSCTALTIPAAVEVQASRFMALYLFAKTNSKNVFYVYNPATCSIVSFGIDG